MTQPQPQQQRVHVVAAAPLITPAPSVGLVGHAEALQAILGDLGTVTVAQLVQLFRQHGTQPDFPATLYAAFPEIVRPHAEAAAQITAQWYDELAPGAPHKATPIVDLEPERITKTIDWALYAPKPAQSEPQTDNTLERLSGSARRMVFDGSRSTVLGNAKTEGVKWARYASATACAFCRLLSTRGAVYSSKTAALKSHDCCRCLAVALRGGEAWTPPAYMAQWEKDYLAARDDGHTSVKAILAHMRANTNAR